MLEKVNYDKNYPYVIKDSWGGRANLTYKDLIELKKEIEKELKKER